jgi:type II secretory pathway pseudopilin PulG
MNKTNFQKQKGFTLVELIVVMAVFMLIVGVAIAIFLSIIEGQKRILAQEQILSQVSYAMEYMSKGLRMAKRDTNGDCLVYTNSDYSISDYFPGYNFLYTRPNYWKCTDGVCNYIYGLYGGVKFINQSNDNACQEFYLDAVDNNNVIKEKKLLSPYIQLSDDYSTLLTSSNFSIDYLKFSINGTSGLATDGIYGASQLDTPSQQPRITIILGFKVPGDTTQPEIKIQTTVSQRNLNAN